MDVNRGRRVDRGAVCRARPAWRRAAHRLQPRRAHELGDRAARVRGRSARRTTSSSSGCVAMPRRTSCSSSWSIRAAPTCGGGAGPTSPLPHEAEDVVLAQGQPRLRVGPRERRRPRAHRSRRDRARRGTGRVRARCGSKSCASSLATPQRHGRGSRPWRRRARPAAAGPRACSTKIRVLIGAPPQATRAPGSSSTSAARPSGAAS